MNNKPTLQRLCDLPDGTVIIYMGYEKVVGRKGDRIILRNEYQAIIASYGLNCQMWVEVKKQEE